MSRFLYRALLMSPIWQLCGVLVYVIWTALSGVAGLVVLMWNLS